MKRQEVYTSGTLGDAFIISCKLYNNKFVRIFHNTAHRYWFSEISSIYRIFSPNVEIHFTDENRRDLLEINSSCHLQTKNMEFFPEFKTSGILFIKRPYIVIQAHAGKLDGGNTKRLSYDTIYKLIDHFLPEIGIVLIGTDNFYGEVKKCLNLVKQTTIEMAFNVIATCDGFVGPEGLMAFFALSQKKDSIIFYRDIEAIKKRILGTPWEFHVIDMIRMDNIIY